MEEIKKTMVINNCAEMKELHKEDVIHQIIWIEDNRWMSKLTEPFPLVMLCKHHASAWKSKCFQAVSWHCGLHYWMSQLSCGQSFQNPSSIDRAHCFCDTCFGSHSAGCFIAFFCSCGGPYQLAGPLAYIAGGLLTFWNCIDHTACWPEAIPLLSKAGDSCAKASVQDWVSQFGFPRDSLWEGPPVYLVTLVIYFFIPKSCSSFDHDLPLTE